MTARRAITAVGRRGLIASLTRAGGVPVFALQRSHVFILGTTKGGKSARSEGHFKSTARRGGRGQ